jgi:site-specific recombinase XerC
VARAISRTKPRPVQPEMPRARFTRPAITAAPAPCPEVPPRPRGELDAADVEQIREIAAAVWPHPPSRRTSRDRGLRRLLEHLAGFDGETWQQRWHASGLNGRGRPVRDLVAGDGHRAELTQAFEALCCLRIVEPSLEAFRSNNFKDFPQAFRVAQADPVLDGFFAAVDAMDASRHFKRRAVFDVCCALVTQGIAFGDLTPEAFLHYARATRDAGLSAYSYATYVGHLAWQVLRETGHFPRSTPATLRAALRARQLSPTELVDQYQLHNTAVRDLLVDYLTRRGHDLDYSSLSSLATTLALTFWKTVEKINPAQQDLRLSEDTYHAWRSAVQLREDGTTRRNQDGVLMAVRALYFDIQAWAAHEPEQWAVWAAPCPIPNREVRAGAQRRQRTRERMADRTRTLTPLLPALVEHVETHHQHLAELLTASAAHPNAQLAVGSRLYQRLFTPGDHRHERLHGQANVRVRERSTGEVINVTLAEDTAFWAWAIVETLRHSGVRIEELLELSQLSIRQYQRPNGEVIALLVIAPSKTDRERVIPMSAELFHVIACIIRRLVRDRATVPLSTRYDQLERTTSDPQPFLFQRRIGQRNEVMTPGAVNEMLRRTCAQLAEQHPQFAGIRFTPHDFRRLFATDLVNHGLPIHIGAALLGHLNLEVTRGYVAVFEEDVIRHYQAHLARRRAMRPVEEYRPLTDAEWGEFEEHFDKRKLELGSCGRPYGTPCQHEHACIRCPMLRVDPRMLGRLEEIETDLLARRARAETEGWLGEIEGIDLTLRFLGDKRAQTLRLTRFSQDTVTALGMPTIGAPS